MNSKWISDEPIVKKKTMAYNSQLWKILNPNSMNGLYNVSIPVSDKSQIRCMVMYVQMRHSNHFTSWCIIEIVGGGDHSSAMTIEKIYIFDILHVVCCDFLNNVISFMCWVVRVYISHKIKYSTCTCTLNWYD